MLLSVGQPFGVADVAAMPTAATTASVSAVTAAITTRVAILRAATVDAKETVPWSLLS